MSSSDQNHEIAIRGKDFVVSQKMHRFAVRLRNQQTIERIAMMRFEMVDRCCVVEGYLKHIEIRTANDG